MHDDGSRLVAHVGLDAPAVLEHRAGVRTVVVAPVGELELLQLPLLLPVVLQHKILQTYVHFTLVHGELQTHSGLTPSTSEAKRKFCFL